MIEREIGVSWYLFSNLWVTWLMPLLPAVARSVISTHDEGSRLVLGNYRRRGRVHVSGVFRHMTLDLRRVFCTLVSLGPTGCRSVGTKERVGFAGAPRLVG